MVILRYISSDQLWHCFMIYKEEKLQLDVEEIITLFRTTMFLF